MNIYKKTISLGISCDFILGDVNVNLNIHDVNGKAIYNRNLPNLLSDSDALIFVYDVCHVGSFETLKDWIKTVRSIKTSPLMVLIGHKTDLSRNVTIDDQISASKDYHVVFNTEVPGFSESINAAFNKIVVEVLSNQDYIPVICRF
jgi:GTPase SAR1 family protein